MRKPLAVERRDYIAASGPSIFGIKRMDKVISPHGEVFIFIGAREGEVILEREVKKLNTEPFIKLDSSEISKWAKNG